MLTKKTSQAIETQTTSEILTTNTTGTVEFSEVVLSADSTSPSAHSKEDPPIADANETGLAIENSQDEPLADNSSDISMGENKMSP